MAHGHLSRFKADCVHKSEDETGRNSRRGGREESNGVGSGRPPVQVLYTDGAVVLGEFLHRFHRYITHSSDVL